MIIVDSYSVHFADDSLLQRLVDEYRVYLYPLITNSTQFCQPMDAYVIPTWKRRVKS